MSRSSTIETLLYDTGEILAKILNRAVLGDSKFSKSELERATFLIQVLKSYQGRCRNLPLAKPIPIDVLNLMILKEYGSEVPQVREQKNGTGKDDAFLDSL